MCIPLSWKCDNVTDCIPDKSDEINCPNKTSTELIPSSTCAPHQASCVNGECIEKYEMVKKKNQK